MDMADCSAPVVTRSQTVTVAEWSLLSATWNSSSRCSTAYRRPACQELFGYSSAPTPFARLPYTVRPRADMASSNRVIQIGSGWFQTKINLRPQHRGVHLVTEEILRQVPELCQFSIGLCHIQILHTSASLALNESWDPDVRDDMEMMLNKIVPEGLEYRHSCEGPDDMPAHVKACFLGSSLSIPITDGKLALGTWQGIWLCEHRNHAGSRKLVVTLTGVLRDSTRSPLSPVSPIASTSS